MDASILDIKKIIKKNKYLNLEKIEEIQKYLVQIKPLLQKHGYDVGEPDCSQNIQEYKILNNFNRETY